MSLKRVLSPSEGNDLYPLPKDYASLDREGKRKARVNACQQWLIPLEKYPQMNATMKANALVASVHFFDLWYLHPDPTKDFDPLFYDEVPLRTPGFHWDILRQWATSDRNIAIAPRGSAKSFLVRKTALLKLTTRPSYSILYATSTSDNARGIGQALKSQYQSNPRLNDDWAPEFPEGRLVPRRGEAPFGIDLMFLKNGSSFRAVSAESRLRGGRPRRFILDDPEFDPKASTSMSMIRQYMDTLLFKMVLPMVMRDGCGVDWLATFVSRRHYAWHALQTETSAGGLVRAADPRFNRWNRFVVRAASEREDGSLVSCWPEMWPETNESKAQGVAEGRLRPGCYSLEEIKEEVGAANFASEYMARPGEAETSCFGQLTTEKHGYYYTNVDPALGEEPRKSRAHINWHEWHPEKPVLRSVPIQDFLKASRLFIAVDTSYTSSKDSDSKVVCVMCVADGTLFVLDLWAKQCLESDLIKATFLLANKWRVPTVHVETVKQGIGLFNNLTAVVATKAKELVEVSFLPKIMKLNPGLQEKVGKIHALGLRFEHGQIKLPLTLSTRTPWRTLFEQIDEFNPEAPDGGMKHDDCIDTVAMSGQILKGRQGFFIHPKEQAKTPIQMLKDGEFHTKGGMSVADGLDFLKIPLADLQEIMHRNTLYASEALKSGTRV